MTPRFALLTAAAPAPQPGSAGLAFRLRSTLWLIGELRTVLIGPLPDAAARARLRAEHALLLRPEHSAAPSEAAGPPLRPHCRARLLRHLARFRPDAVVVCGPELLPLVPGLAAAGLRVVAVPGDDVLPDPGAVPGPLAESLAAAAAIWAVSPDAAARLREVAGPDRVALLDGGAATVARELAGLGIPATPGAARPPAAAEGLTTRYNPRSGLLQIGLRLHTPLPPEAVRGELRVAGATALNLAVETGEGPPGRLRVEATAVLRPGDDPAGVRLLLSAGDAPLLSAGTERPILETAGLATLEPQRGAAAVVVQAWADTPAQLRVDDREEPLAPALPGLLRGQLLAPPTRVAAVTGTDPGMTTNPLGPWLAAGPRAPGLDALRNRHAGETAWLIGNGPSVRPEDLDALRGRLCFGFNRLYLAYGRTALRPRYTLSGDGQVIGDFGAELVREAGGTVFLASEHRPELPGNWFWLRQYSIWPTLFSLDPGRVVGAGGSSLFVAMQLGWWMGVRRFMLYGVDFHFADAAPVANGLAQGDGNHFIPGYRSGRAWIPPSWRDICTGLHVAGRLAEAEGGWIRNATRGGRLELFPRRSFEDALRGG
ncbi:hypothetical protein [Roseomonas sp. BN140053]|uniref:hypothetical protein n=1 Tax=Roseomonas sp. BN140053 TaxID=3391898 RepID=UPI0039EACD65